MVTVFHYTPVNTKQFDGLNIDGLAGKRQKRQRFPVKILRYMVVGYLCYYLCGRDRAKTNMLLNNNKNILWVQWVLTAWLLSHAWFL